MKKKVQVLLSAYNGEKYLCQQLDSIFSQSLPPASVLVRDDGSADQTRRILQDYQAKYPQLQVIYGENMGSIGSFFELFRLADPEMDYYALADQDDVWMEDKIEAAVKKLQEMERECQQPPNGGNEKKEAFRPLLYCGAQLLTDEDLHPIESQPKFPVHQPCFGNALVQNICTGCTAVYNSALAELLRKSKPEFTIMHDWWLYLLASCYGQVYYDPEPHIYYRQHGRNVYGAKISRLQIWKYRLRALTQPRIPIREQLLSFGKIFPLEKSNQILFDMVVQAHLSGKNKWKLAREKRIFRQKKSDDLIYRGLVLLGRI